MNEDPIQRQLRQQQEEITKLRGQLQEMEMLKIDGGTADPYKVNWSRAVFHLRCPGLLTALQQVAEREALLSALEELRRSSWDAVRSSSRFSAEDLQRGAVIDEYPVLVTLTPDPMLSGKLKYGVGRPKDQRAFRIGRAAGLDLELDGVGICQEHCEVNSMRLKSAPPLPPPSPVSPVFRSLGSRLWLR